jgi:gamma-tubulin complex component 5
METSMEKAEDIDEMAQIHVKYVAKLQERAMLSSELKPIHKAFVEILDLGVLFTTTVAYEQHSSSILKDSTLGRTRSRTYGRKIASDLSDEEDEDSNEKKAAQLQDQLHRSNRREALQMVDREFSRLLSFLTAGLRSVGRVGAEPMWEQLAERLEWEGRKDRA